MARSLDFKKNTKMVTQVMKKSSDDLNNKKRDIPMDQIDMNPDNEEIFGLDDIDYLAENIDEDGFQGAIEVYALDNGRYEICSGHRRFLAMKQLGKDMIPCIVTENVDDVTKAKRLVKSNILNRKMSPLKWAKTLAYYEKNCLADFKGGRKRDELARVFNMSSASVGRYTSLLKLIPSIQVYADEAESSINNLLPLTTCDKDEQNEALIEIISLAKSKPNYEAENPFRVVNRGEVELLIRKVKKIDESVSADASPITMEQLQNRLDDVEELEDAPIDANIEPDFSADEFEFDSDEEQEDEEDGAQVEHIFDPYNDVVEDDYFDGSNAAASNDADQVKLGIAKIKVVVEGTRKQNLTKDEKKAFIEQLKRLIEVLSE